ncbi:putative flavoprotein YqcA (clustered with tRNA pseudouridine synthase C) [Salmonella enterica subsp. enterica]|uniref:Putative flavoprotein YqcA (Clustered with tRNA pseudouridine synthase C) n=1 Tax=Salmonella enterica I TaxID=59201 RepID=A0A3S4IQF4_SALET|nr:putative flavoprotein YqcA (clustered with tRNA pseudouridine synthase C) [Salmonella enterica subsp. enterica]
MPCCKSKARSGWGEMLFIDASEHPEPESQSNPWVENWGTLLS